MTIGTGQVVSGLLGLLEARLQPVLAARGLQPVQSWLTVPDYVSRRTDLPLVAVHGGAISSLDHDDSLHFDAVLSLTVTVMLEGDSEDHVATLAWEWQRALVEVLLHYPLVVAGERCDLRVLGVDSDPRIDPVEEETFAGWDVRLTVHVPNAYDPSVDPLTGPVQYGTAEELFVTTPLLDVEV